MTQQGNLYEVVRDDGDRMVLRMNADHPVYAGHFPGMPVTPGVLTLRMIRECAGMKAGRELRFKSIKNCRLTALVRPGNVLALNMEMSGDGDTVRLKATLTGADNDEDIRLQLDAELQ